MLCGKTKKGRAIHAVEMPIRGKLIKNRTADMVDIHLHQWYLKQGWTHVAYCGEYTNGTFNADTVTCKDCLAKLAPKPPTLRDKILALPQEHDLDGDWIRLSDLVELLDDENL